MHSNIDKVVRPQFIELQEVGIYFSSVAVSSLLATVEEEVHFC